MEELSASLLTYSTKRKKFDSVYERNKFYRGLFGYKQTVRKNGKEYSYEKDGLMDEIPHMRIDDSVFVTSTGYVSRIEAYFDDWGDKVSIHVFTVIIEDQSILERIKGDGDEQ